MNVYIHPFLLIRLKIKVHSLSFISIQSEHVFYCGGTKLDKRLMKMNPTAQRQTKGDQRPIWNMYNKLNIGTLTVTGMGSDPKSQKNHYMVSTVRLKNCLY